MRELTMCSLAIVKRYSVLVLKTVTFRWLATQNSAIEYSMALLVCARLQTDA